MSKPTSLFLFAHQDDETGVFFELQRLIRCGENVIVVYLTSGDLSGKPSSIRDMESISILEKLGVLRNNIHFLGSEEGIPDGKLCCYLESAFHSVSNLLGHIGFPQSLYFLAWEGGHQDHDAAHLIGLALGKRLNIIDSCFQFPLYTGYKFPSIFFRLFVPLPNNGAKIISRITWLQRFQYLTYCLSYPSQKKTWLALFPFFLFHYLFFGTQIFQTVSLLRIMQQPHTGTLLYERRAFYTYNKFFQNSNNFVNQHINSITKVNK
jgi:LmbE family N-acetylglucosaminyl deacetylase